MSIIQKPVFNMILKPNIIVSFLKNDVDDLYTKTIDYIKREKEYASIVIGGSLVYEDEAMDIVSMVIAAQSVNNVKTLKDTIKLVCKHNKIIAFFQYGTSQRVYDHRED